MVCLILESFKQYHALIYIAGSRSRFVCMPKSMNLEINFGEREESFLEVQALLLEFQT